MHPNFVLVLRYIYVINYFARPFKPWPREIGVLDVCRLQDDFVVLSGVTEQSTYQWESMNYVELYPDVRSPLIEATIAVNLHWVSMMFVLSLTEKREAVFLIVRTWLFWSPPGYISNIPFNRPRRTNNQWLWYMLTSCCLRISNRSLS